MQGELIFLLREEENWGEEGGGGIGFLHQQESELAAPSVASWLIQGVFWAAKLHLQDGNRGNYRYRGGKAEPGWIFLEIFLISPLCPIALSCMHGVSLL